MTISGESNILLPNYYMFLGDYRIEIIPDAEFRLDGGAMFGVVPRVLWEKVCPPDEFNRIKLNKNCVFVETPTENILIETGIGEKWTEKQTQIYGIFRVKSFAEILLEETGCAPEDITLVINTHLHFDYAGGNTSIAECGIRDADFENDRRLIPQFPNARYLVSKREFENAENPSERDRASYLPENWQPLLETGQLELKEDTYQAVEGLTIETVRGHSETMQNWKLSRGDETLYGFADLIPTRHHLSYAWIMGYDLYPTETLEAKKRLIPQAVAENWICLFYHDFEMPLCRLTKAEGKLKAIKVRI